jgi:hypothetical protein
VAFGRRCPGWGLAAGGNRLSLLSLAVSWSSCVSKLPERRKQKTNCFRRWRMKCRKSRRTETSYLFFPFGFGSLLSFYFIAISNLPDVANGTGWSSPSAATDRPVGRDETILWRSRDRRLVSLSFACLVIFSKEGFVCLSLQPNPGEDNFQPVRHIFQKINSSEDKRREERESPETNSSLCLSPISVFRRMGLFHGRHSAVRFFVFLF